MDWIIEKVSPEPNSGCWLWLGTDDGRGYGRVWKDQKIRSAHRVAYELMRGPIPSGLELDHLCRVKCCVNPQHLEPVTKKENLRRRPMDKIGSFNRNKTHCPAGHLYSALILAFQVAADTVWNVTEKEKQRGD